MATSVKQVLEQKGTTFHAVRQTDSVFDALSLMAQFDIGCVLVTENERLIGIFTERDYARKVVLQGRSSRDTPVRDIMTAEVVSVAPGDSIDHCMQLVTDRRIRHLPVVDAGVGVGVLSSGDLVKTVIELPRRDIDQLQRYIAS